MSEIAKCPVCGKAPVKMVFGAGWATDGYKCCGYSATTITKWNRLAAAIELAKWTIAINLTASDDPTASGVSDKHEETEKRVLEVFK